MRLPNSNRAFVDLRKLRYYCLDETHGRGKHKARVFRRALGWAQSDALKLQAALLVAAREQTAVPGDRDAHGQRYTVDFSLVSSMGSKVRIRSCWIVRHQEDFPRLVTCFVLGEVTE
jgi:hypothetical protein